MACFLVPTAEAIVTTVAQKVIEKKESETAAAMSQNGITRAFSQKLKWLNHMLWGGSALLAFEHLWHGEIIPTFPFLTAAYHSADFSVMLHELATSGVAMAALVTAVWGGIVGVTACMEKSMPATPQAARERIQ
ncbi:MAG: hypothetical protein Q4D42_00285 [Eubacteriales bacterium]|nr:hypothetical protein [Eubacteriales bacterium]